MGPDHQGCRNHHSRVMAALTACSGSAIHSASSRGGIRVNETLDVDFFPEERCLQVIAELSVWTSVDDCLAAARIVEGRCLPDDSPSEKLIIPFLDDDTYEAVLLAFLVFLVTSFRVPGSKVRIASLLDSRISPETSARLE